MRGKGLDSQPARQIELLHAVHMGHLANSDHDNGIRGHYFDSDTGLPLLPLLACYWRITLHVIPAMAHLVFRAEESTNHCGRLHYTRATCGVLSFVFGKFFPLLLQRIVPILTIPPPVIIGLILIIALVILCPWSRYRDWRLRPRRRWQRSQPRYPTSKSPPPPAYSLDIVVTQTKETTSTFCRSSIENLKSHSTFI